MSRRTRKSVSSTKASTTNTDSLTCSSSSSSSSASQNTDVCPCKLTQAPSSRRAKGKAGKASSDMWISCDICKQWWRALCAGISDTTVHFIVCFQTTYKCPKCCVLDLPKVEQQPSADHETTPPNRGDNNVASGKNQVASSSKESDHKEGSQTTDTNGKQNVSQGHFQMPQTFANVSKRLLIWTVQIS